MSSSCSPSPFILTARDIAYDNSTSGLTAENLQDAIDEVAGANPPPTGVYQVITGYGNLWSGYPAGVSGTGYGVKSDYSISAFTGSITPPEIGHLNGFAFGFVVDGDDNNLYALLLINGATGYETLQLNVPGLDDPLYTSAASYQETNYGDAFLWWLGDGPVPAQWASSENSFTMEIFPES